MPIIYLDILIVLNWFIDYLLLSLTARFLHMPIRRIRLVLGSLIGGVAACQILLNVPVIVSVLLHFVSALAIIRVSFAWYSRKTFARMVLTFFCVSALLSGLVTALWRLTGSETVITRNGVIYCDISPLTLTVAAMICYGIILLYERITAKRAPEALEYILTVNDGRGACECRALYDTGLHLREPFSGAPVIVVQRKVLQPYLTPIMDAALACVQSGTVVCASGRVRMIPYRSVSGEGLLPAFVPDKVSLRARGKPPRDLKGVYVALSDEPDRGAYTALFGSDVMDW